jgi:hypothetical protein
VVTPRRFSSSAGKKLGIRCRYSSDLIINAVKHAHIVSVVIVISAEYEGKGSD